MRVLIVSLIVSAMLSAADRAIALLQADRAETSFGSPSAGTLWLSGAVGLGGHLEAEALGHLGGEVAVDLVEHAPSCARGSRGRSTLPSSKRSAWTMCCFSGSDWLFQNSVAWLKWSKKFSLRSRTFVPVDPSRVA